LEASGLALVPSASMERRESRQMDCRRREEWFPAGSRLGRALPAEGLVQAHLHRRAFRRLIPAHRATYCRGLGFLGLNFAHRREAT
jgi:hypothetical protein